MFHYSLFNFFFSQFYFFHLGTPNFSAKTMNTLEFMCARRLNKFLDNKLI